MARRILDLETYAMKAVIRRCIIKRMFTPTTLGTRFEFVGTESSKSFSVLAGCSFFMVVSFTILEEMLYRRDRRLDKKSVKTECKGKLKIKRVKP